MGKAIEIRIRDSGGTIELRDIRVFHDTRARSRSATTSAIDDHRKLYYMDDNKYLFEESFFSSGLCSL